MPIDHPLSPSVLRADIARLSPPLRQALVRDAHLLLLPPDPTEVAEAFTLEGWTVEDSVRDVPPGLLRLEGHVEQPGWPRLPLGGIVLALRASDRLARMDGRWVRLGRAGRPADAARLVAVEARLGALRAALLESRP